MKKRLSLMLVTLMAFGSILAACGGDESAAPADTNTPTETSTDNTATPDESTAEEPDATEEPAAESDSAIGLTEAEDMSLNPAAATARTDSAIIGLVAPQGVFNPMFYQTTYDAYVNNLIFPSLLKIKGDGTYENDLAESIDISDDNKTYTFKIRDDANYTDGTPVTAGDYLFAMKVYMDASYDGQSDPLSWNVVGAQDYHDGKAKDISGIKVVDDKTVEVTVSDYDAMTQVNLGGVAPLSEAYYGKSYKQGDVSSIKELNNKPMGAGPYKLTKYTAGQEVDFEANENYYDGAPKIPKLIYKVTTDTTNMAMLQSGETDLDNVTVNEDNVEELKSMGFLDVDVLKNNGYGYVAMNNNNPLFTDPKVRQALTYGLNRAEVVEAAYGPYAEVINIPQSDVSWAYTAENINTYDYDPEKAKQLLDEAGWVEGSDGIREKDGKKFEVNFSATADNPVIDALIPIMTENYEQLGIKLVVETLDFNAIMEKKDKGDYDMFFAAWGLTPDPDSTVYVTDGAQNNSGYSNKEVDELYKQGKKELDLEKRKAIYAEIYQKINADAPEILMYQRTNMNAINGRLDGWDVTPYKEFPYSLHQVEISQ
ncbi:ABC transporter substrate-binding protein [Saccharibacillus sp. CPCC 101409]|uniref:ABC transporter substrate-binding protein n=1 Tax=Saccharibacillus sp. CPCC 101409 TaxID=3058041 RepID=UPI0026734214|nr:ABC transporter substrate-binding protein [Saccharibacillus sp. CPCC 101409]MDO3413239.1 ABC transporter substrate-binding protein [Saccharibacillus sp. CPCC 101409]